MEPSESLDLIDAVDVAEGLIPDPLFKLVSAIGKPLFRAWWKRRQEHATERGQTRSIVQQQLEGAIAQRAAQQQFEELALKIVTNLSPMLEGPGHELEGDALAVVAAAAEAFAVVDLSPDIVVDLNKDPERLAGRVAAARPDAAKHLSADATNLYHRVLHEISRYVVEVASEVSAFKTATDRELLERSDLTVKLLLDIVEKVNRVTSSSTRASNVATAREIETDYRLRVADKLGTLEIFGADLGALTRQQALNEAFVYLNVARDADDVAQTARSTSRDPDDVVQPAPRSEPITNVLAQTRRLLVHGPAGIGKTTLLQWIAVRSATSTFPDVLRDWNGTIPFLLRLRKHRDGHPKLSDFISTVAPALSDRSGAPAWVEEQFDSDRAVVLIDGFDEVDATLRPQVLDYITDLVKTYSTSRFVVTARTAALKDWRDALDFRQAQLLPLDFTSGVPGFVDQWHRAVAISARVDDRPSILAMAPRLTAHVEDSQPLREIATTPLLCALLCALHLDQGGNLPRNRAEFFEAATRLLLKRDENRGIRQESLPLLSDAQQQLLLQDLAWWLVSDGASGVTFASAEGIFKRRLPGIGDLPPGISPEAIRRLFVERIALIRDPEEGVLEFAHNAFRDYLAAKEAVRTEHVGQLANAADDDRWRETIVFAAALAPQPQRHRLIRRLIERGDVPFHERLLGRRDSPERRRLHFLAAACQAATEDKDPDLVREIQQRLETLVPPATPDDVDSVAAAGDLAVPLLAPPVDDQKIALNCVKALGRIKTSAALAQLTQFLDDPASEVAAAVLATWSNFNPHEFARRILPRYGRDADSLSLSQAPSLDGIEALTQLKSVDVWRCPRLDNVAPLGSLRELRSISLRNAEWRGSLNLAVPTDQAEAIRIAAGYVAGLRSTSRFWDLVALTSLHQLERLTLSDVPVEDLGVAALAQLPALERLGLDWTAVTDDALPTLAQLGALEELSLAGCPVTGIGVDALAQLPRLRDLNLFGTLVNDATVPVLRACAQLRRLSLSHTGVGDAGTAALGEMPALETLQLSNTSIGDGTLATLGSLPSLTLLDLEQTRITDQGLRSIESAEHLNHLDVSRTSIGDAGIVSLARFPSLRHLDLSHTRIGPAVFDTLPPLSQLYRLNLSGAQVTDATIARLPEVAPHLAELFLRDTSVSDDALMHLARLTSLRWLSLQRTRITGATLHHLAALESLTSLDLSDTLTRDAALNDLARLPNLRRLYARNTQITQQAVDRTPLRSVIDFRL